MSIDAIETFFIWLSSWRRAQQRSSNGFNIGLVVVEETAIEFKIAGVLGFLKTNVRRVGDLYEY